MSICSWRNMDVKELENQYSPSRWSKRFSESEIIQQHLNISEKLSQQAIEDVPHRLDVPYGDKPRTKLDIFGEDLSNDSTIMVYVHGGYWQELNKSLSHYPVLPLYKNTFVSVIMGYTLAPESRVEEIIEEVRKGLEWVCSYAKKRDSKAVYLMGWSAGAHLITQVMSSVTEPNDVEQFSLIRGLITLSGVFDLRPLVPTYINAPLFLSEASAWDASPMKYVGQLSKNFSNLRMFVAVAENESPEFKRQSFEYFQALQKSGMNCQYETVREADHFSLVEDLSSLIYPLTINIINFLK